MHYTTLDPDDETKMKKTQPLLLWDIIFLKLRHKENRPLRYSEITVLSYRMGFISITPYPLDFFAYINLLKALRSPAETCLTHSSKSSGSYLATELFYLNIF